MGRLLVLVQVPIQYGRCLRRSLPQVRGPQLPNLNPDIPARTHARTDARTHACTQIRLLRMCVDGRGNAEPPVPTVVDGYPDQSVSQYTIDVCVVMRIDACTDMRIDMYRHAWLDMYGCIHRRVHRHMHRHIYRHVYRYVWTYLRTCVETYV